MNHRKMIIVHGDKGGVGKSTMANLCVDYLLDRDGKVVIVEGDKTISDVAARHAGVSGVQGSMASLARPDKREEAVIALFENLDRIGEDAGHVVINTPASASETLDAVAELFIETAHMMGFHVHVGWMLGDDEIGAAKSAESELCRLADRRVAILNGRFGGGRTWKRHAARNKWTKGGGLEVNLPELTERAAEIMRATNGRLSDLTSPDGGQSIVIRQVAKEWLHRKGALAAAAELVGEEEIDG